MSCCVVASSGVGAGWVLLAHVFLYAIAILADAVLGVDACVRRVWRSLKYQGYGPRARMHAAGVSIFAVAWC